MEIHELVVALLVSRMLIDVLLVALAVRAAR